MDGLLSWLAEGSPRERLALLGPGSEGIDTDGAERSMSNDCGERELGVDSMGVALGALAFG